MALFSKKEDTRYIQEFDAALGKISVLSQDFRKAHFESAELFTKNFEKEKSASDLEKERRLFEKHLDILQQLKFQTDVLIDEAFKLVRNETALTEKDRFELRKLLLKKPDTTSIKVTKTKKR